MKIEKITCGIANAFLIHGDNGSILIDTGTKRYKEKVLKCCEKANVKFIILTHGHFDHCQNASYLAKKLNCLVGIGSGDVLLLEENEKRYLLGKGLWGSIYAWASNRNIWKNDVESVSPSIIMDAGMSLLEFGVDGNIIRLTGHTKGSIGIALTSGELFVGDAMQNIISPTTTWCYEDYQEAQESAKLIKNMNAKKIYYGHGRSTERVIT